MKEEDDFLVSWTDRSGHTVEYRWSRLSADNKRRAWDSLDARGRETGRELIGRKLRGRIWLRANDDPGRAARDKSAIEAAERKEQERAAREEEERRRAAQRAQLLEEIRHEWAADKELLEKTIDRQAADLRKSQDERKQEGAESMRLRAELERAHAHAARLEADRTELNTEFGRLKEIVGTGQELGAQISAKRAELAKLSNEVERVNNEFDDLSDSFDAFRRQVALRRTDRFLWDAAPVELVEHLSFLVPAARTDGAIAVLIHRGMSPSEIAKSLRVSRERVMAVLDGDGKRESVLNETREWMGPAPDGYYSDGKLTGAELVAEVWKLHDGGKSQRETARLTGARLAAVNEILKAPRPVAATNSPTTEPSTAAPSEP